MQEYKKFKLTERGKQRQIVKPDFAERIKRRIKEGAHMKVLSIINLKGGVAKTISSTSAYRVLDARDFGLPQARERVFTISVLDGEQFCFDDCKSQ